MKRPKLDEREALLVLLGSVGIAFQIFAQFSTGSADPALAAGFFTFVLVGLGFRLDRAKREDNGG